MTTVKLTDFAKRLSLRRIELGIDRSALARILDVGLSTISLWETGRNFPEASKLPLLARVLKTSIGYLFGERGNVIFPGEVTSKLDELAQRRRVFVDDLVRVAVAEYIARQDIYGAGDRPDPVRIHLNENPPSAPAPYFPKPIDSTSAEPGALVQAVKYQGRVDELGAKGRAASRGGSSRRRGAPPPSAVESRRTPEGSAPT